MRETIGVNTEGKKCNYIVRENKRDKEAGEREKKINCLIVVLLAAAGNVQLTQQSGSRARLTVLHSVRG